MTSAALLPTNATPWEAALAEAWDDQAPLASPIERIRRAKWVDVQPDFVPFLISEFGLGELTPYVLNHYDLIRYGPKWQRVRGTPAAVHIGLSWLALSASIKEARTDRRWWNAFQLYLDSLPGADAPDLERIENVASLSVPLRSQLRRGVHGYDVPMMVLGRMRLGQSLLGTDSGVALRPGGTRWSFGRTHEVEHVLTEAEGLGIGNWIEEPEGEEAPLRWEDANFTWASANFTWDASATLARQVSLAAWFTGKVPYLRLSDGEGVIGYRRARACHRVGLRFGGAYGFADQRYSPADNGAQVYLEAMTGFGDGAPRVVTEFAFVFGADIDAPAGKLWLSPTELTGGAAIAVSAAPDPIELRATVRQRFKLLLRF